MPDIISTSSVTCLSQAAAEWILKEPPPQPSPRMQTRMTSGAEAITNNLPGSLLTTPARRPVTPQLLAERHANQHASD